MEYDVYPIMVELENGKKIYVDARVLGGREKVASTILPFKGITEAIEGIATSIVTTLEKVKPKKASVEFGIEIALESGQLTALLVKGSGTSNLKITLEWGEDM